LENRDINSISRDDLRPMVEHSLIKKYQYKIEGMEYSGDSELRADTIVIHPIERGNMIQFLYGNSILETYLPLSWIQNIDKKENTGFLKINEYYLHFHFSDPNGNNGTMKLIFEDYKYLDEILKVIQLCIDTERNNYWDSTNISFATSNGSIQSTEIYPKTPFLSNKEELLWVNGTIKGTFNKSIHDLQAITNCRIFEYNYENHMCSYILISSLDDAIVMNRRTSSRSTQVGNYIGSSNIATGIGNSASTSIPIGDLVFIYEGKPFMKFSQISDPDGLAELVKITKRRSQGQNSSNKIIQSINQNNDNSIQCINCNHCNPVASKYCNNCGSKLINQCKKCDNINQSNSNFCNNCGSLLQ
jgi:hypothetical protein